MNKLLPLLILLLFATATASATTLHGTALDVDTGDAVGGVKVLLTGSSSTTWTDDSGKFDLTVPKDTGGELAFESESPCYYTEVGYNPPSSVEGYYPDTDEIWVIFQIPNCASDTPPSTDIDPAHPGPDPSGKTPSGMTATSTAGRWGGGILTAFAAVAVTAVAVIVGAISVPAVLTVAAIAAVAFVIGFTVLPILTEWGVPGMSWLTGSMQDAGNSIANTFGFHFNTTDPKTVGEGIGDGVAEVVKTITEHVINVYTEALKEATGLSESMIWLLSGVVVIIILLMWYSHQKQQSMMYTLSSIQNSTRSKK